MPASVSFHGSPIAQMGSNVCRQTSPSTLSASTPPTVPFPPFKKIWTKKKESVRLMSVSSSALPVKAAAPSAASLELQMVLLLLPH